MASYLMKYKGIYRLKCDFNRDNNQFGRKLDGTLEDIDVYIPIKSGQITHYGKSILQVWFTSAVRGRNVIKAIEEKYGNEICTDITDNESELLFKFNSKYMEQLEEFLLPKTGGASISPFSTRNLKKNTEYKVPQEFLSEYSSIIKNVPKNKLILLSHITTSYLKSLCNKKHTYKDMKDNMLKVGIKGKDYIFYIEKWENYLKYLRKELSKNEIEIGG